MKQILLPILGTVAFIIVVGLLTKNSNMFGLSVTPTPTPAETKTVKVGNKEVQAEIADTPSERSKGLGGRKSLGDNNGMLFIFDKKDTYISFWMKDMSIPIDIIWINDDKVYKIDADVKPEPGVADNKLKLYMTDKPIDYVLEVNSGFAQRNNIKVGDLVKLPSIE